MEQKFQLVYQLRAHGMIHGIKTRRVEDNSLDQILSQTASSRGRKLRTLPQHPAPGNVVSWKQKQVVNVTKICTLASCLVLLWTRPCVSNIDGTNSVGQHMDPRQFNLISSQISKEVENTWGKPQHSCHQNHFFCTTTNNVNQSFQRQSFQTYLPVSMWNLDVETGTV